jgi:23S rRNA pseudouridine955/2504/2580 synthase/23S rRNA pseudouridine1911/1915/1917 synthase
MSIQLNIPDHILFEDEYIIVLYKPCSLMVEPDRNGYPNLLQQVQRYLKTSMPVGTELYTQHIHRLDRPVSGIVLFAKQRAVLKNLSEQFAERRVKKYYQALTINAPAELTGTLEHWHRKEKKKAVLYNEEQPWSEKAILNYNVKQFLNKFLWNIELHTGKYHQIRAQLSATGCPIIGDTLYGSDVPYRQDSIALHACKLIFFHPVTNEEIVIEKENEFNSN